MGRKKLEVVTELSLADGDVQTKTETLGFVESLESEVKLIVQSFLFLIHYLTVAKVAKKVRECSNFLEAWV